MNKHPLVRKIYLYALSFIGLILVVIGLVKLVNLGLKAYIFTNADDYYAYPMAAPVAPGDKGASVAQPNEADLKTYQDKQVANQRERDASDSLAMIIVGLPLYLYHWSVIKKDKDDA